MDETNPATGKTNEKRILKSEKVSALSKKIKENIRGKDYISRSESISTGQELRDLINQYKVVDAARKVVGMGSVGTKAWIVVMEGYPGENNAFETEMTQFACAYADQNEADYKEFLNSLNG